MKDILQIVKMENKWERFLKCYHNTKMDIVLYGAGQGSDWAIRLLQTENISPTLIIDNKTGV